MKKIIGTDIGNSKTEIVIGSKDSEISFRQPSVISEVIGSQISTDQTIEQVMSDLYNNITVHISSKALNRSALYHIGSKALNAQNKSNMNLSLGKKSENDIPVVMTLGMIAASAVKEKYEEENELPESISLSVDMATAIPSSEYTKPIAEGLEKRFVDNRHIIVVHVADEIVQVTIKFTNCKVTEEGKTAMLAFSTSDDNILAEFNRMYNSNKSVQELLSATSLHVDIGDGTTEFTTIEGLQPIPNLSRGKRLGVGYVSDDAIRLMQSKLSLNSRFTRQELQEWMKKETPRGEFARQCFEEAKHLQADEILNETFVSFQEMSSSQAELIFVHGGGSITFKENMLEKLYQFAEQNYSQVVWIDKEYATSMNSRGTYVLAKALYSNKK
ncbi:ParM/StbA family protein [Exiguobacterium sp. SH5S4]|uniref:ParM/StbA family protein n=1 Tax=Exiguobacterium sp. SH5S4 TaxID=2510961 RepID=UPI00103E98AF|nr:ParM/StbA family protein [Exiguobacterium sp. SH5S4]TCI25263.1 ParM/StbA family protein [Exiguobacterium sp. SH5S4]